jgi:predicted glycogen debranching enzyme
MTLPEASPLLQTNAWLRVAMRQRSSPATTGSATGGRDTMIALPGLTLTTGKYDVARSVLRAFAKHVDQGMLPNRFPDAGETPEYNAVDAALWFSEAARAYLAYTSD